jgi:EPS-associated MarR family transcriptional regulator
MSRDPSDEVRYRLLKYLTDHPSATQRELARELGVSVGKANYCLNALIEKGLLKARNFRNSNNKPAYLYLLTASGLEEKINITRAFLHRKRDEYDFLAREIERLTEEVGNLGDKPERSI